MKTLEALSKLEFASAKEYVYFHYFDAFHYLLTTSNVKKCIEIYENFLKRKQHPCEKSFTKIIEYAIKEGILDDMSVLLDDLIELNKLNPNALKDLFGNLKIANRIDLASKILLNIPIENPSINYIWDFFINGFFKSNEMIIKNTLKTFAKLNIPEKTPKIEAIYNIYVDCLLKNK